MSHDEEMADATSGAEVNGAEEEIVIGKQRLTLVSQIFCIYLYSRGKQKKMNKKGRKKTDQEMNQI